MSKPNREQISFKPSSAGGIHEKLGLSLDEIIKKKSAPQGQPMGGPSPKTKTVYSNSNKVQGNNIRQGGNKFPSQQHKGAQQKNQKPPIYSTKIVKEPRSQPKSLDVSAKLGMSLDDISKLASKPKVEQVLRSRRFTTL